VNSSENVLEKLEGIIVSYRLGPKTQRPKECIVQFCGVRSANEAARLIGRKVMCPVGKRIIRGKIAGLHGKNGLVKARFRKGVSGKVGTQVKIVG